MPYKYKNGKRIFVEESELDRVDGPTSVIEVLEQTFEKMPLEVQARFGPYRIAFERDLLAGRKDRARKTIEIQEVPPELEPLKQQLLAFFDA